MTRSLAALVYAVLVLSGFAGLGYQAVWTRMVAQGVGHEYVAALGVVAAFFCGLGLGSLWLDGRISRSARPAAWYAALEAIIGVWALALIWLIPAVNAVLPSWLGPAPAAHVHWLTAFAAPFVLFLPATLAMGGTLPAADRLVMRLRGDGLGLGGVYGANTFGAMAGALATTFFIVPAAGYSTSLVILALINGVAALALIMGPLRDDAAPMATCASRDPAPAAPTVLLGLLFATGLLGIGYEVVAIRALSQVLENTVFSFAALLATYLLGTAIGAGLYHRHTVRRGATRDAVADLPRLLQLQALTGLLGVAALWIVPDLYRSVRAWPLEGTSAAILAELAAGAAVFLLPTMVMGAVFTALAQTLRRPDGGVGTAMAANTFGAACAPVLFGILILPQAGVVATLAMICAAYLVLLPAARMDIIAPSAALAAAAAVLVLGPVKPSLLDLPEGTQLHRSIEGVMGTVTVYADDAENRYLKVNNHFVMGGTATKMADRRQGHGPLLLHPNPKKALFLGVGTGATFAAAAYHPDLTADAVELVPEVLDVLPDFEAVSGELAQAETLRLYAADARRFVASTSERYDVIVSDTFHPSRDGAGLLYTVEHFEAIRDRLAEGGLFCQWLPLHQLDLDTLKVIIRSFLAAYPDGIAVLNDNSLMTPVVGLIGGRGPLAVPAMTVPPRPLLAAMQASGLVSPVPGLEGFVAGPDALKAYAGPGPLNTDDHPLVLFNAPRAVYDGLGPASERALSFVEDLQRTPPQGLLPVQAEGRMPTYWRARDRYLVLGSMVMNRWGGASDAADRLDRQLIEILNISSDFAPAYEALLRRALDLHENDPPRTLVLLMNMVAANPSRREAYDLISRWFPGAIPGAEAPSLNIMPAMPGAPDPGGVEGRALEGEQP